MSPENKDFNKKLGEKISLIRKQCGLTQVEVGKTMNMSRANYINMETGRNNVTAYQLSALANIFGCEIVDFFSKKSFEEINNRLKEISDMKTCVVFNQAKKLRKEIDKFLTYDTI